MNLPKTITVDFQPYGVETLGDLSFGEYRNSRGEVSRTLIGTVIEGYEDNRLFGHTLRKDTKGRRRTVYGITDFEIERGHIVRVAM